MQRDTEIQLYELKLLKEIAYIGNVVAGRGRVPAALSI